MLKVLAINCGSSTLKFQLFEVLRDSKNIGGERRLARGLVDKIGAKGTLDFAVESGESLHEVASISDHRQATRRLLEWLLSSGLIGPGGLAAVGHRVVHGGNQFTAATLIDEEVLGAIELVSELAPLHNGPALRAIYAARDALDPAMPMVAVFDTAFHSTLPDEASVYAMPPDLSSKHHIRRYGFHGIAHRYMVERYSAMAGRPIEQVNLVTLQLGNGCSATAVRGGRSVDTSMGFTPLEGLMMGTRSGDLDPSIPGFLARREGISLEQVEDLLNKQSGLLGVSGISKDMREIFASERKGNERAALAVAMFCYRVKKYIGAYLAVLGGADAVIFGGGIGENAAEVRARICAGMEWCGLRLDEDRNADVRGSEGLISTDDAGIHAYVIPVDEAIMIARDTVSCLQARHDQ